MSNKPTIPAWQRAQQPLKSDTDTANTRPSHDAEPNDNNAPGPEESTPEDGPQESNTEQPSDRDVPLSPEEQSQQLDLVKSFLQDPGVKDEPVERKREFLEQKGIPQEMIDQELGATSVTKTTIAAPSPINASEFASFKEAQQTPRRAPPTQASAPPIITYPEFLEDARKPPPLITPTRILNAAYVASGIAALAYGASTFLVKPTAASLTDARHDFASHSQTKIDELNERLSTLVSKIPEAKSATEDAESDDAESVASDPTELFHRDIGTQTSPAISPPPPTTKAQLEATVVDKQNERLAVIQSHLNEMLAGVQAGEQPAKDRLEATNKLRHHLDDMMYKVQTANIWNGGFGADQKAAEADDAIEQVKKEVRGVKGVLLSAKRFAPVSAGRIGS